MSEPFEDNMEIVEIDFYRPDCDGEAKVKENQEEDQLNPVSEEQEYLESIYGGPLKLLSPKDQLDIVADISEVFGNDGEFEVKRLIVENRLPVIVGPEGGWYTEWYPEGDFVPVEGLVLSVVADCLDFMRRIPDEHPKYLLRECLARAIDTKKDDLVRLMLQLRNEGEHSSVLERQIEWLNRLNTTLPFCREELSDILN